MFESKLIYFFKASTFERQWLEQARRVAFTGFPHLSDSRLRARGPWMSSSNTGLNKSARIPEGVNVRIGVDAKVFNQPGLPLPDTTTGILTTRLTW